MKSFNIPSFVFVTILGLLQFGGETDAVASPVPPEDTSSGGYYVYVYPPSASAPTYPQPDKSQYSMQQYSKQQYMQPQYMRPQYQQPQYMQPQYAQPQYMRPQYQQPQYVQPQYMQPQYQQPLYMPQKQYAPQTQYLPQTQIPSYIPPRLPSGEFEGLSDQDTTIGDGNIDFTGFDILGDVNLPVNVLSITDILS